MDTKTVNALGIVTQIVVDYCGCFNGAYATPKGASVDAHGGLIPDKDQVFLALITTNPAILDDGPQYGVRFSRRIGIAVYDPGTDQCCIHRAQKEQTCLLKAFVKQTETPFDPAALSVAFMTRALQVIPTSEEILAFAFLKDDFFDTVERVPITDLRHLHDVLWKMVAEVIGTLPDSAVQVLQELHLLEKPDPRGALPAVTP